jgi:hypothetical protein
VNKHCRNYSFRWTSDLYDPAGMFLQFVCDFLFTGGLKPTSPANEPAATGFTFPDFQMRSCVRLLGSAIYLSGSRDSPKPLAPEKTPVTGDSGPLFYFQGFGSEAGGLRNFMRLRRCVRSDVEGCPRSVQDLHVNPPHAKTSDGDPQGCPLARWMPGTEGCNEPSREPEVEARLANKMVPTKPRAHLASSLKPSRGMSPKV